MPSEDGVILESVNTSNFHTTGIYSDSYFLNYNDRAVSFIPYLEVPCPKVHEFLEGKNAMNQLSEISPMFTGESVVVV